MNAKTISEEESFERYKKMRLKERQMVLLKHEKTIIKFREYCKKNEINLNKSHIDYVPTIGIVATYPNILKILSDKLNIDKENLVLFSNLSSTFSKKPSNPGYLFAANFMAMLSPVFRRGLYSGNNWAPRFVELFWAINDPNIESSIALDYDRVRINVDDTIYIEADTWYGAPFNESISQIPDGPTNLRPPIDLDEMYTSFLFSDAYALDVFWSTKNEIKTFQALEFKTENITFTKNDTLFYPARYIHAEYDLKSNSFRHFDGAIQYFTPDEYYNRRDSNFRYNIKEKKKVKALSDKCFKFNGIIPIDFWSEFCAHFLTANPLIHEYFSGSYPEYVNESLQRIKKRKEKGS